jgi:hypothetical protein
MLKPKNPDDCCLNCTLWKPRPIQPWEWLERCWPGVCKCPNLVYAHQLLQGDQLSYMDGEEYSVSSLVGSKFGCVHHQRAETEPVMEFYHYKIGPVYEVAHRFDSKEWTNEEWPVCVDTISTWGKDGSGAEEVTHRQPILRAIRSEPQPFEEIESFAREIYDYRDEWLEDRKRKIDGQTNA